VTVAANYYNLVPRSLKIVPLCGFSFLNIQFPLSKLKIITLDLFKKHEVVEPRYLLFFCCGPVRQSYSPSEAEGPNLENHKF